MIKFESDDEFNVCWDPVENKYFVAMDCNVSGKEMTLKAEADEGWLVNVARFALLIYANRE